MTFFPNTRHPVGGLFLHYSLDWMDTENILEKCPGRYPNPQDTIIGDCRATLDVSALSVSTGHRTLCYVEVEPWSEHRFGNANG